MQTEQPLLSVLIPTFNAERYLKETLETILQQSLKEIEILVIDGGSTDRTRAIAEMFGCRVIALASDYGYGDAFSQGVHACKGKYIVQCCSSDGFVDVDWFKDATNYLENNSEVSLVWGYPKTVNENGEMIQVSYSKWFDGFKIPDKHRFIYFWLWYGMNLPEGNLVIHRTVLVECFPDNASLALPESKRSIDPWLSFLNNFHEKGFIPGFIPSIANYGRLHSGSITINESLSSHAYTRVQEYTKRRKELRTRVLRSAKLYKFRNPQGELLAYKFSRTLYFLDLFVWRRRFSKIGVRPTLLKRVLRKLRIHNYCKQSAIQ
jgi:glycosyltransferase involved in cell wall biosynthesis